MLKLTMDEMGTQYILSTDKPMNPKVLKQFPKYGLKKSDGLIHYSFAPRPNISYIIQAIIDKFPGAEVSEDAQAVLDRNISLVVKPSVFLFDDTHVGLECPGIPYYMSVMDKLGAAPKSYTMYTVAFSRAFEVIRLIKSLKSFLPEFEVQDSIKDVLLKPLDSFDGTLSSLFTGDIRDLFTVNNAWKAKPEGFEKVGYTSPAEFALKKPLRYIDKTKVTPTDDWEKDEDVVFIAKISDKKVVKFEHGAFTLQLGDSQIDTIFYRRQWMVDKFPVGEEVLVIGKYTGMSRGAYKVAGASMDSLMEANSLPIVPLYSQSTKNNVNTKIIMNAVYELFDRLAPVTKDIAGYINKDSASMSLQHAVKSLHFPENSEDYKEALEVLAYYELVFMQLLIIHRKATEEKKQGLSKPIKKGGMLQAAITGLPFDLTSEQRKALRQLSDLLTSESAEQALVSGDVGSGKTAVAQLVCLQAVEAGYQAVLAGPTEVLSEQLYKTFCSMIDGIPQEKRPSIVYLSGALKAKEKREVYKAIEYGEVDIIVGTHSVLNKNVPYKNLGVVCVDEQQKFGSAQREALLHVREDEYMPDIITLTATPIPRSTAQVFYGDINLVTIEAKPAGRLPIITEWIKEDPRKLAKTKSAKLWKDIKAEVDAGHKVFVVVPMVNENAKMNVSSVKETLRDLKKVFPNENIEAVHGQMKKDEQTSHIENFRSGDANILIASTVIEVGVDIPLATRMVILSADRLGASSLHQIRGRVGRNSLQSKCYLVSNNEKENNTARLMSLVNSNNGFEIATADLHTRGEGDLFGTTQSGSTSLRFANLVDHSKLIESARAEAQRIYTTPRKLEAVADAEALLKNND